MKANQPSEKADELKWYQQYNLPTDPQYFHGPLLLLALCSLLMWLEPASSKWLAYQRDAVENLELWRLLSANLVHTNLPHFLLNSLGLLFIWFIHAEHYSISRYFKIFIVCALFTGLGMHFFDPIEQYRGLSGALHGLIMYGAVKDIKGGLRFGWALFFGIIIKVGYENLVGATESVAQLIDAEVAVRSHFFGLLGGMLMAAPIIKRYIREGIDRKPDQ